jgi:hypothetical protein
VPSENANGPALNLPTNSAESITCANVRLAALLEYMPEWHLIHKVFFEIAVTPHTESKDAGAIANAIGCAPLLEIPIQSFLIPWLEQGFR